MTLAALIAFRPRMSLHVGSQVGSVSESTTTMSTTIWFLAGMGSPVTLQQPRSTEGFTAQITAMFQIMCENVHGQCGHRHVGLVAMWALSGGVTIKTSVRLLVSAQVG